MLIPLPLFDEQILAPLPKGVPSVLSRLRKRVHLCISACQLDETAKTFLERMRKGENAESFSADIVKEFQTCSQLWLLEKDLEKQGGAAPGDKVCERSTSGQPL